jgi:hypothetical protein
VNYADENGSSAVFAVSESGTDSSNRIRETFWC